MNTDLFLRGVRFQNGLPAVKKEDEYLLMLPAVRALEGNGLSFSQPVTFLMGENGSGKSTLLEAVAAAWGFNPEGGSRNFHFSTQETHSGLYRALLLRKGARRPHPLRADGSLSFDKALFKRAANHAARAAGGRGRFVNGPYTLLGHKIFLKSSRIAAAFIHSPSQNCKNGGEL